MEFLFKEREVTLEDGDAKKLKELTQRAIEQKIHPFYLEQWFDQ